MENEEIADNRFHEVLTLEGIQLSSQQAQYPFTPFLRPGCQFPEFFSEDTLISNRTIKELIPDSHSNLRIVYFEVFRLADQSDDDSFLTNLKRRVFSLDFDIMFTPQTQNSRTVFNDFQFKRFFAEFVSIFEQNEYQPIHSLIQRYPIMDQVLIHILRSILAARGVEESFETRISTEIVFEVLGKELGLDIVGYGKCWKFEDADMVCYEGPEEELWIVYSVKGNEVVVEQVGDEKIMMNVEVGGGGYSGSFDNQITYSSYIPTTTVTTSYQPISYTSYEPLPTYSSSYQPYHYTPHIDSASSTINLSIYQPDQKANALVNKYLNISTNPEDVLGTKYTVTETSYYTPAKVQSAYESYGKYETSYKTDGYGVEGNSLLDKYSNPSVHGLDTAFGGLNIGTSYTTSSTTVYTDYPSTSYTTDYKFNYEGK